MYYQKNKKIKKCKTERTKKYSIVLIKEHKYMNNAFLDTEKYILKGI